MTKFKAIFGGIVAFISTLWFLYEVFWGTNDRTLIIAGFFTVVNLMEMKCDDMEYRLNSKIDKKE